MSNTGVSLTPEQALEKLQALYDQSVSALCDAIRLFIDDRSLPSAEARANGLFVYPQLSVSWSGNAHKAKKRVPLVVLPTPAAIPRPSRTRRFFAATCSNS